MGRVERSTGRRTYGMGAILENTICHRWLASEVGHEGDEVQGLILLTINTSLFPKLEMLSSAFFYLFILLQKRLSILIPGIINYILLGQSQLLPFKAESLLISEDEFHVLHFLTVSHCG